MAAATSLTFDITPPRRPSLDDIGGASAVDHASKLPSKATMPYADAWNQMQRQIERLSALTPVAVITVHYTAGVPAVTQFIAARTSTVIGDFTCTDNATGDVSITWAANTFPTATTKPMAALNDDTVGGGITVDSIANGVRVKMWTGASTAADRDFTVTVR